MDASGTSHVLNRYDAAVQSPRPESFIFDMDTAHSAGVIPFDAYHWPTEDELGDDAWWESQWAAREKMRGGVEDSVEASGDAEAAEATVAVEAGGGGGGGGEGGRASEAVERLLAAGVRNIADHEAVLLACAVGCSDGAMVDGSPPAEARRQAARRKAKRAARKRNEIVVERRKLRAARALFRDVAAACESGHDFSSRWFGDASDATSFVTTALLPVDLNAVMFRFELNLAAFHDALGSDGSASSAMREAAAKRNTAINALLWDAADGTWRDGLLALGRCTPRRHPAPVATTMEEPAAAEGEGASASASSSSNNSSSRGAAAKKARSNRSCYVAGAANSLGPTWRLVEGAADGPVCSDVRPAVPMDSWYGPRYEATGEPRGVIAYASDFFPLWAGCCTVEKARRSATALQQSGLVGVGGVQVRVRVVENEGEREVRVLRLMDLYLLFQYQSAISTQASTLATGQQWDAPNCWAPLQDVVAAGLFAVNGATEDGAAATLGATVVKGFVEGALAGWRTPKSGEEGEGGAMHEKMHAHLRCVLCGVELCRHAW